MRLRIKREKIVNFRLTEGQWRTLCAQADSEFSTPSEVIRFSIAEYLARRGVDIKAYRGATRGPWPPSYIQGSFEHLDNPNM